MIRSWPRRKMHGFSLVELMIAITLGLLLTAAIGALFYTNKKNFNQNRLIAVMQDNARFALETVARDLAMAGFLGGMTDDNQLEHALAAPANDCTPGADGVAGWAFDGRAIEFLNNPSTATASGASGYACLQGAGMKPSTDVLSIRRVSGVASSVVESDDDSADLDANTYYLRTNRTQGELFHSGSEAVTPSDGAASEFPHAFWEYFSRLYFIRDYAETPGDGIPSLCRAVLINGSNAGVEIELVAEGVEDMQLAFGIDNDGDGIADIYAVDPTVEEMARAVTARVQLLVRSVDIDSSYKNDKTYRLLSKGNQSFTDPGGNPDHYYRRVIQTTVVLRNPALVRGLEPS